METKKPENPPAFPTVEYTTSNVSTPETRTTEGLSMRDYFAAKAMQGLLSNSYYSSDMSGNTVFPEPKYLSDKAYEIADAMLKARQNKE
jgi:hypothetical protein